MKQFFQKDWQRGEKEDGKRVMVGSKKYLCVCVCVLIAEGNFS